jgi:ABC-type uncharacterized transport system involved in gliding motility auxiliary subunit
MSKKSSHVPQSVLNSTSYLFETWGLSVKPEQIIDLYVQSYTIKLNMREAINITGPTYK